MAGVADHSFTILDHIIIRSPLARHMTATTAKGIAFMLNMFIAAAGRAEAEGRDAAVDPIQTRFR